MEEELRILMLDAVPADAEANELQLRKEGLQFTSKCVDGREGFIKALDDFGPDLILAAHQLPGFSGTEALEIAQHRSPYLPFVFVTGALSEEAAAAAIVQGASDYVLKSRLFRLTPAVKRALVQAGLRQEHARSVERVKRLYSLLLAIRNINQLALRTESETELFQEVCNILSTIDYTALVWIGVKDKDSFTVRRVAHAGVEEGYLASIKASWDDSESGMGPTGMAIKTGTTQLASDTKAHPRYRSWQIDASSRGFASSVAVPFSHQGEVLGALNVYSKAGNAFESEEISLLEEIADDITLGLKSLRLETALRESFEALRESSDRFEGLAMSTSDLIWEVDEKGICAYLSPAVMELLGYTEQELVGQPASRLMPPSEADRLYREYAARLSAGKPFLRFESAVLHKNGQTVSVETSGVPIIDTNWQVRGFRGISRDITERKRAENELRESEAKLRQLAESLPQLVWTCRADGPCDYLSPQWVEYTGIPEAEQLGFGWLNQLHPDDRDPTIAVWNAAVESDAHFDVEFRIRRNDGIYRWFRARALALHDKEGRVAKWFGTNTDIDDQRRAEEKLRNAEERFRIAAETSNDAVYEWDLKQGLQWFGKIDEMLGYEPGEFSGSLDAWINAIHQEDRDRVMAAVQAHLAGKAPYVAAYRIRRKDGVYRWWEARGVATRTPDGKPVRWIGTVTDVTERKRAEQTLRESEARFKTLFTGAAEGILVADLETKQFTLSNPAVRRMLGYTEEELIRMQVADIHPKESLDQVTAAFEAQAWGDRVLADIPCLRKDGTSFYAAIYAAPMVLDGHKCNVGFFTDTTERKTAEHALATQRERLAVTLRTISDGVIATDKTGRIDLMNPAAEKITGWPHSEAKGRPLAEVLSLLAQGKENHLDRCVEDVIKSDITITFPKDTMLTTRDQHRVTLEGDCSPLHDQHSEIVGAVCVFRDISEMRWAEEELLRMEKLESIGILAGGIAHDFKNLLTPILGNLSLAKTHLFAGGIVFKLLDDAEKAAARTNALIEQLLAFSKGEASVKKAVAIGRTIRDSAGFVVRGSKTKCEFSIADDLWSAEADINKISQVIQNIVLNANQAMPHGGLIRVTAENLFLDARSGVPLDPGKYIKISVADQGTGIPEDALGKIFDPYFTTKSTGSGLGLAVSYAIVKKHGGHVTATSQLNVGTTFCVYLPATGKKVAKKEVSVARKFRAKGRVLVMDDEEAVRQVACAMLKAIGIEADSANDGEDALNKWKTAYMAGRPFAFAIADLTIPGGMGGKELVKKLTQAYPGAKVLVSSGYSNDPIMASYKDYGFAGAVPKPYTMDDLREAARKVQGP